MLVIRDAQLKAFSEAMLRSFAIECASRVRVRFPAAFAGMTETAAVARVLNGVERARRHGVTRRQDIEQFIDFECLYGPDFEIRHAEPGRILARMDIDGVRKMALIENWELFDRPTQSTADSGG